MTTIAGASQYLTASTYANTTGESAQPTTLMSSSTVDIVDIARGLYSDLGVGISSNARALNKEFLSSSSGTFNTLFSTAISGTSTIENLQTQILGLRASLPSSSIGNEAPTLSSETGSLVDTEA